MFSWLDGSKSYIGAVLMIVTGLSVVLGVIASVGGSLMNGNDVDWQTSGATFAAGMAAIAKGIRDFGDAHKKEKQLVATESLQTAVAEKRNGRL